MRPPMVLFRSLLALVLSAGVSAVAWGQLPQAVLTSVFPPGGKIGTTFDVAVIGQDMDDVEQLQFSHPGIKATLKMAPPDDFSKKPKRMEGTFSVTIEGSVPPGLYEARVVGRYGTSNPRLFIVGQLEEIIDAGGNNATEKAQEIKLGSVVSAKADNNQYKYYKIALKQNERIVFDCQAQRIDSRFDATLVVLSPAGKELARARDTEGSDACLEFTAPADGEYLIRVFDAVYGGGPDYFFRLAVTARPHIAFVFPPAGQPGANGNFTVYGQNLPGGKPVPGWSSGGMPLEQLGVSIAIPGDPNVRMFDPRPTLQQASVASMEYSLDSPAGKSNVVPVYLAKAPVIVEKAEANDTDAQAQPLTLPCEVAGQFFPQSDVDWYQFEAKKDQVFLIDLISHRLALPTDPYIALFRVTKDDNGEKLVDVAQVDDSDQRNTRLGDDYDTSTDDPSYKFTVPEDGIYKLLVRDNFGSGRNDPGMVYRLVIRPPQPNFTLVARPAHLSAGQNDQNKPAVVVPVLRKGGTALIEVEVLREDDFNGDVEVSVEGLPAGMTSSPVLAGSVTRTVPLVLAITDAVAAWSGPIKIIGKAKVDGGEIAREARYAVMVWGSPNRQQSPPTFRFSQQMQVSVVDKEAAPVQVQVDEKIFETALGGNLEIPVMVKRYGDYKEAIKLTASGLPNEIKPKEINADASAGQTKLEITLNQANIKPGTYTFYLKGEVKQKYVRNPDAVPALEAEQKDLMEMIAQLTEAQKQSGTAKDEATKKAAEAAAAAKQAEQEKNAAKDDAKAEAEKKLADAQAAAKTADEAKAAAEQAAKDAADKLKKATEMKTALDTKLNQTKQANQPKDISVAVASTPVRIRIAKTPISLEQNGAPPTVKQGDKVELPIKLNKLFGFDEAIEVTWEPKNIPNLNAKKIDIAKGAADGKFEITAAKDTPAGEHQVSVKAKGKWNNINVEAETMVTIKVEAAPPEEKK